MSEQEQPGSTVLGERHLTTVHAIGQSLAIGPIFSAGLLAGLIAGVAGFSTPASVLLASFGALGLAYVVSLYARKYAGAGAIYEYLTRGASTALGVTSGGMYFIAMLVIQGSFAIGVGFLVNGFWMAHISASGAPVWWIFSLLYVALIASMNYFGVKLAIRGVIVLAMISTIPLLILAVAIIAEGGAHGQALQTFSPFRGSLNATFNGVLFAVTLFVGFEAAASIAEEAENPRRSIPRAVLTSVALAAVFYLLMTYAATIGFGQAHIGEWAGDPSPLGTLAHRYVGSGLATMVELVIIFDMVSAGLAFSVTATRGVFALARDRLLPRGLEGVSRHGTPVGGVLAVCVVALITILWGGITHYGRPLHLPNEYQAFVILVGAGSFVIELIYIFLAIYGFRLVHETNRSATDAWRYIFPLLALAAPVLALKGSLDPWPTYPNIGIYIALGIAAIAVFWYAALRVLRPDAVSAAASYAAPDLPHRGETVSATVVESGLPAA